MAIVGGNAGRAAFQYWNGSAWTDAQTPGSNNALLVLEVEDILYNPLKVKATLINRPLNPRSGTAASTTSCISRCAGHYWRDERPRGDRPTPRLR